MIVSLDDLTREEKVSLYVIGILDGLKHKGLVKGGWCQISEDGEKTLAALRASGFQPTSEEIEGCMTVLKYGTPDGLFPK